MMHNDDDDVHDICLMTATARDDATPCIHERLYFNANQPYRLANSENFFYTRPSSLPNYIMNAGCQGNKNVIILLNIPVKFILFNLGIVIFKLGHSPGCSTGRTNYKVRRTVVYKISVLDQSDML